jgi:hypothetical protein
VKAIILRDNYLLGKRDSAIGFKTTTKGSTSAKAMATCGTLFKNKTIQINPERTKEKKP